MLSIGMVSAKGGRYYTELARTDYYVSGGESPGVWHENEAARQFGLSGVVAKNDLERLFDGYHPKTGEALAQNHGKPDRRAALDLCLSVPKDVSALWAVSGDTERRHIEASFDRALAQTLNLVNENFGYTRRGQGGYEREKVDLLVGVFLHRQSRSQDPQLHAHCLALNAALRADGSYGTIDAGPLLSAKKMIGAYFRSALSHELGIPLEADRKTKFSFRVPGVPEELSEHWSSRAREIEEAARARGVGGGAAKAYMALETRRAKDEQPLSEVKPKWRETGHEYGFTAEHVAKILSPGERRPALSPREAEKLIDAALKEAVTKHAGEQAHFSNHDLLRDVCVATAARGISPETIRARVEASLRAGNFVALGQGRNGEERYATVEMYHEVERRALEVAKRLGERESSVVSERRVEKAIAKEPRLNEGQREAVRTVCLGPDLTFLEGPPGSGKSTLFEVARKAIEKGGGNVIGLAPSNRAARELEKNASVKCYTIDRFLYDRERGAADLVKHHAKMLVRAALKLPTWKPPKLDIDRRTTLIIDECAMVSNDKLSRALRHAEKAGCRVVLAGDTRQLPAIGPGGLFRELAARASAEQKTTLTEIVRQRETWAREAIHQVGRGEAKAALTAYGEKGRLHVMPTRDEAIRELVSAWSRAGVVNPRDNLILAATNTDVARLNGKAQTSRWEAGQLGYRSVRVGEERIHEGDRILFTDTDKRLGLVKSAFGTVTRIERLSGRLTVQLDGQDDRPVRFSLREFDSLRLGYAATTHRAQGMTLEQDAYVLLGGSMQSKEMTYVQMSRARGETHLFSDAQDGAELERLVRRSEEKRSAHGVASERGWIEKERGQQESQEQAQGLGLSV